MIEVKKVRHFSSHLKKLFNKALRSTEQKNYPYAIELFRNLLRQEPGVLEVRRKLREVEYKRLEKQSAFAKLIAPISIAVCQWKSSSLIKEKKFNEALDNAEGAMKFNPLSIQSCMLLVKAAEAADASPIAEQVLEMTGEYYPDNLTVLYALVKVYSVMGNSQGAVECLKKLVKLDPNNKDYRTLRDQEEAEAKSGIIDLELPYQYPLEEEVRKRIKMGRGSKRPSTDPGELARQIKMYETKTQSNDTAEGYKTLADLYIIGEKYDQALECYNHVVEFSSIIDTDVDYAITELTRRACNISIKEWREYTRQQDISEEERENAVQEIRIIEQQKSEMQISRARERFQRNPHSPEIHFELAVLLSQFDLHDEAIHHLQQLQNNARFKERVLLVLGKSYFANSNYVKAKDFFQQVIDSISPMNELKKYSYYFLGKSYEMLNKKDESSMCYKKIFAFDETYKDVENIIDKIYRISS